MDGFSKRAVCLGITVRFDTTLKKTGAEPINTDVPGRMFWKLLPSIWVSRENKCAWKVATHE